MSSSLNGSPDSFDKLLPQHLAQLRASGLSDDTIRASLVFSLSDPAQIAKALNWTAAYAAALGPCLVFPYLGPDGVLRQTRIRPDTPRQKKEKDGKKKGRGKEEGPSKPIKYEQPAGQPVRLYVPPFAWSNRYL